MAALANPVGDFPLNDDWAYGWTVRVLLERGELQLSDWTAISPLPQIVWGALFCLPSGFSFTSLRLSTLVLGLGGIIATYALLHEIRATPKIALLGALTVATNPMYLALSSSFMSDVPSYAFMIGGSYFLIRALRRDSAAHLAAGLVVASLSILNRPGGLVVLPAFGVAYQVGRPLTARNLVRASLPSALGLAVYVTCSYGLHLSGRIQHLHNLQTKLLLKSLSAGLLDVVSQYFQNVVTATTYIGLFVFPFLLIPVRRAFSSDDGKRTSPSVLALLLAGVALGVLAARYRPLPWIGNVLQFAGIGPTWISEDPGPDAPVVLIHRTWQLMTLLGVMGAALLCGFAVRGIVAVRERTPEIPALRVAVFAITTIVLLFLPIGGLPSQYWFDRYLLPFLPFVMLLVAVYGDRNSRPYATPLVVTLILLYGGVTVAAAHDYLSWSRVSWQAAHSIMRESGAPPGQVSAGFEFRGWYLGNRLNRCNPGYRPGSDGSMVGWRDFSCLASNGDEQYSVSPVAQPNFQIEKTYSFRRWLLFRGQTVYVLRRSEIAPSGGNSPRSASP